MALPPIVTNSPLYKALTGGQDKPAAAKKDETAAKKPAVGDTVSFSSEAVEKLKAENIRNENAARQTANDVRDALVQTQSLSLSKDGEGLSA